LPGHVAKNSLQNRHFWALALIASPQKGHTFVAEIIGGLAFLPRLLALDINWFSLAGYIKAANKI